MEIDMNTNLEDHHSHYHICSMRCISWSAIIFAAVVAIALSFLFNLFTLAVGLTAFPVSPEGKQTLAIGGFVWLVLIAVITMFIPGWVAGFLGRARCYKRRMGELYGFGTWGLALIATLFLVTQGSQFLSQRAYMVDRNLTAIELTNAVQQNVRQVESAARKTTPPATKEDVTSAGVATFATFFILFIGALSATFGGRMGMRFHRNAKLECPQCR